MGKFLYHKLFCVLILAIYMPTKFCQCSEDDESFIKEFVPTKEWQRVEPGQQIPPGLHVRMDLQGGGKWAKLLDDEDKSTGVPMTLVESNNVEKQEENVRETVTVDSHEYKLAELKQALKNMKEEKKTTEELEHDKQIKDKFRSMDEIKSAFDELNLKQESDFEAMTRLLATYKEENSSPESKALALEDIEYYVHQVDNANDFIKINGLQTIIEALNNTHPVIRQEAAHVIGSTVQSNPSAQVKAVELGCLPALLRLLGDTKQPMGVRRKAMYAVSSLIRNFPAAQHFFNNAGGFGVLMGFFTEVGAEKLQLKAVLLINDLAVERREVHSTNQEKHKEEEKMRQYRLFSLSSVIEEIGFCEDMAKLINSDSHEWREVLVKAMRNLHGVCKQKPAYTGKVAKTLLTFETEYSTLMLDEEREGDHDSFFHHMHAIVAELLTLFKDDGLLNGHEEL